MKDRNPVRATVVKVQFADGTTGERNASVPAHEFLAAFKGADGKLLESLEQVVVRVKETTGIPMTVESAYQKMVNLRKIRPNIPNLPTGKTRTGNRMNLAEIDRILAELNPATSTDETPVS